MWMNKIISYGTDIFLSVFAVYLCFYYFDIFFERKKNRLFSLIGPTIFLLWQFAISSLSILPLYINIAITIAATLFMVMVTYEGTLWNKCVFSITFNAIWMLMEIRPFE